MCPHLIVNVDRFGIDMYLCMYNICQNNQIIFVTTININSTLVYPYYCKYQLGKIAIKLSSRYLKFDKKKMSHHYYIIEIY